jgi:hypothetical protein
VQVGTTSGQQTGPAEQDPNVVPNDGSILGPDDVPYNQQSNDPEPTASR